MNRKIIAITALALTCALPRAAPATGAPQTLTLRHVNTVASFSGAGTFRNIKGFWRDPKTDYFFVLDDSPPAVYIFDRNGRSLRYFTLDESLKSPEFVGAAGNGVYLKSEDRLLLYNEDFSEYKEAQFYFAPPARNDKEPERIPLEFTTIFTNGEGLFGYDPQKKIIYKCGADGLCAVFIRTVMKYGSEVLTGRVNAVFRDRWGRFFLVEKSAGQVWKFAAAGRFIGKAVKQIDLERDRLFQPELVALDRMKRCYIYDAAVRRLKVYDDLGLFVTEIDTQSAAGSLFILPAAMDTDDLGHFYVIDRGDMTVKIFEVVESGF